MSWCEDTKAEYPTMFKECFDFSVGEGWKDIINKLCAELYDLDPTISVVQVKEKFGGLRFYLNKAGGEWDIVHKLIHEAEAQAEVTCEWCGKPGKIDTNNFWMKTLCPDCIVKRKTKPRWSE